MKVHELNKNSPVDYVIVTVIQKHLKDLRQQLSALTHMLREERKLHNKPDLSKNNKTCSCSQQRWRNTLVMHHHFHRLYPEQRFRVADMNN